ncbi:MAG: hypothetical protein HGGPFJEG_03014 [Ignavibacteria bacterium]|nr:hypothetical protein [Ignavibacteria bacterium]
MKKSFTLFIICMMISVYGCGDNSDKKENAAEKENQKTLTENKNETTGDPVVTENTGETSSGENTESKQTENELGMTPGLPKDFPQDIPLPPNSKTLGSMSSSEGTVVPFESKEKVQELINFYKEELKKNGFKLNEDGQSVTSDKGGMLGWTKDKREIGIVLAYDKDKDATSLVITYK